MPLALGAVAITAGIVRDAGVAAGRTGIDVSAQGSGSAGTQVAHDGRLLGRNGMPPAAVVGMGAQDISDF
jgi:hypothetical protein